jgi:hypothetical protein
VFDENFAQQINLTSIVNAGLEKKNSEALKNLRPRAAGLLALPLGRAWLKMRRERREKFQR